MTSPFRSPDGEAAYRAAYAAVLAIWPIPVQTRDVPTPFGSTRVTIAGPDNAPPLVLLAGGGATSTVWFANAGALAQRHRLYAIDVMGDAGHSLPSQPLRSVEDLMAWLDGVLTRCGLDRVAICGHSYGGWIALTYALRHPDRVRKLVLLDPTASFTGWNPFYLLHALPLAFSRKPAAMRRLLRWETRGAPLDPAWLNLVLTAVGNFRSRIVFPRRPTGHELGGLTVPTLVLAAQRSRAQPAGRLVAQAQRLVPGVTVAVLPGATHHTMPSLNPAELNDRMLTFLD